MGTEPVIKMAVSTFNYHTGPSCLVDVGRLAYNGCLFSPLFRSSVSGVAIKDNANRTIKYMEYTITVDGYVTLPEGADSINATMITLRQLLTQQGGKLQYIGRGCDIIVNTDREQATNAAFRRSVYTDAVWGPVPQLLEFQPLGGGLSAKIVWECKVCVPEVTSTSPHNNRHNVGQSRIPLLQFNYETIVSYNEDGYSTLRVRGTAEIPITRTPSQQSRTVSRTADDVRVEVRNRVISNIDLSRFRITKREFNLSRDKRTLEWDFTAEEKPYMDLPPGATVARGTYNVRPAKTGMGLVLWLCTLRATYTIRADWPRRAAWVSFLYLLRERMAQSRRASIPNIRAPQNRNQQPDANQQRRGGVGEAVRTAIRAAWNASSNAQRMREQQREINGARRAWLLDFSIDEGLYLDSKTVSFSAAWRLTTSFSHILLASGLWTKVPERRGNESIWETSMRDISGEYSWLANKVDANLDIIVDFGGG